MSWQLCLFALDNPLHVTPFSVRQAQYRFICITCRRLFQFELPQVRIIYETLVKIGVYLLGGFGDLIADNHGCSPIKRFLTDHQTKISLGLAGMKAITLSSFVKFVNLFPEFKFQLLRILSICS